MAFKLASRCQIQREFTPISWTEYFDEAHDIQININPAFVTDEGTSNSPDSFRVYMRNFKPPYAPERQTAKEISNLDRESVTEANSKSYSQYPTLVALHGGGYSGLTWAEFTKNIEKDYHCRVLAIDLRGHGDTKTSEDDRMDIDTLVDDVIQVVHSSHQLCGFLETPMLVIIGHSMGGAVAIKCSSRLDSLPSLVGFVVIDVVEGTAKDALPLMMSVIKTRPNKFPSLMNAIEWSVRSGMAKNVDAARVSMPGNLLNISSGHLSIHDIKENLHPTESSPIAHKFHISIENLLSRTNRMNHSLLPPNLPLPPRVTKLRMSFVDQPKLSPNHEKLEKPIKDESAGDSTINEFSSSNTITKTSKESETDQFDSEGYKQPPEVDISGYCWRTDLAKTQPHWPGWFEGLSQQMLDAPVTGKFLLLAGIDRLDKTLTIGQMQGKFMMKVLPKCGHAVHEDSPGRVATEIGQFLVRNKFTTHRAE